MLPSFRRDGMGVVLFMKTERPQLDSLRAGWGEIQKEELRLLRLMSVSESINQWLLLEKAFEGLLQDTANIYTAGRRAALAELQARLGRQGR